MIVHILIILALVAAGIGGAVLSIPDAGSLAYMRFKDGDHASALDVFEQQWKNGDTSIDVVMPLVEIYQSQARPGEAVAPFEALVEVRSGDVAARRMLGDVYRQAYRPADYARNLEIIARTHPGEADLRELARIYEFTGQTERQIDALTRLAALTGGSDPETARLAALLATSGRIDQAIAALVRGDDTDRDPLRQGRDSRNFLFALLTDTGRIEEAAARVERWIMRGSITAGDTVHYAAMLSRSRHIDLAVSLLASLRLRPGMIDEEASIPLVHLQMELGQMDEARETLTAWQGRGITADYREEFIHLALGSGLFDAALAEIRQVDPAGLSPPVLATLAEIAFFRGGHAIITWLEEQAGTAFYDVRPIFAAELARERGQPDQARQWALRAAANPGLSSEDRIRLGNVLVGIGLRADAEEQLRKAVAAGPVNPTALTSLAFLFLNIDRADEGYRYFSSAYPGTASPAKPDPTAAGELEAVWSRAWLAAASRRGAEVIPLVEKGVLGDPARLQDLFFIASNSSETELANAAANRLYTLRPDSESRTWLAQSLIAEGRPGEALEHLRDLLREGAEVTRLYEQALERVGGGPELVELLRRRASDDSLPVEQRRETAHRLLRAGERNLAQEILTELAAEAPPDSADVRGLLYIWGPRPDSEALDWLEKRALHSDGSQKEAWLDLLAARGGAARVVALIDASGTEQLPYLRASLISALQRLGDHRRLTSEINAALSTEKDPARLETYARAAEAARQPQLAERIWRTVLEADPQHAGALRQMGIAAAARGNATDAADLLGQFLAMSEGDLETNHLYSDVLITLGRGEEARPFLERTLSDLRSKPDLNVHEQVFEARILGLLGRTDEMEARDNGGT